MITSKYKKEKNHATATVCAQVHYFCYGLFHLLNAHSKRI